ncbi:DUF6883 domain-containing protein [Thalassotalea euphylliae]|uniref:DUF6883 domain-containing protein n=1 Tax=Thalassotalea euphylliae TaxID=1655234 RepID=A0A3E0TXR8_9GAMM|nr:DUF6883 domain-containing protein [Thalassotalea euphylliae]REL24445.1 hypothetical protein DXX94_19100 [Thalassotalea euphylliae]REL29240.1 hypothetical protein DXX94_00005 [Thalassotalea euphylliae]
MNQPFAFFFDADHSELGSYYGPPCTSKIVSAAESSAQIVNTQVLRGDIMPYLLANKISEVSKGKSKSTSSFMVSHSMSLDKELYKLILCDFSESLDEGWNTVDTVNFPFKMARTNIWCIVLTSISQELAAEIDQKTNTYLPYLGACLIDTGNPLHLRLFQLQLMDGAFIQNNQFYYRSDYIDDYEEDLSSAESYGSMSKPILLEPENFVAKAPHSIEASTTSIRGALSMARINGKSQPTHSQKVARELLDYLQGNPEIEDVYYKVNFNHKYGDFVCEKNKVKNYLLNLDHSDGGSKAKFFINTLGIKREDWRYLADQISGAMKTASIFRLKHNNHGINHGALIEIIGRNNRRAIIQTGWMVNSGSAPRLVTAYPYKEPLDIQFDAAPQNISPIGLKGNARWSDIYQRTNVAGELAAQECIPTPMTLAEYSPIFDGACGFAWVTVPDARKGMARWLKDNNIGHRNYKSGWDVPANPIPIHENTWDMQSIEPKKAYAEAFGKVLRDNGIDCKVSSRLD